ncbi:MAG: replication endonuclease [Idiomarina sp.]|nr:replication endonuclease [Idiomarina sp.]
MAAQHFLESLEDFTQAHDLDFLDTASHKDFAVKQAERCKHMHPWQACAEYEAYGFNSGEHDEDSIYPRLCDESFWLRCIRTKAKRVLAEVERSVGLVSKRRSLYCGSLTLKRHEYDQEQSQEFLQRIFLQSDSGERLSLAEISQHSVSNKEVLFAEWITRMKGTETVARMHNYDATMVTMTAPGFMHAVSSRSGKMLSKYQGMTVEEVQAYLNTVWRRIRAKLHRDGIKYFGMRVVEPHHDGTPHWHMLLFMPPEQKAHLKNIIQHYALQLNPDERGAKARRVDFIDIDYKRGSAVGYLAKYLGKNMTGKHENDRGVDEGRHASARSVAWASAFGIRQFQAIGGPSVTVWRELRRLDDTVEPEFEAARYAADGSDWAAFWIAQGGIDVPRNDHAIKPHYELTESIDFETGEVRPYTENRYGEPAAPKLTGLFSAGLYRKTRTIQWKQILAPPRMSVPPQGEREASGVLDLCK